MDEVDFYLTFCSKKCITSKVGEDVKESYQVLEINTEKEVLENEKSIN